MALEKFKKQPSEADWKACDFLRRLENVTAPDTPDTIASIVSAVAYDETAGAADASVLGSGAFAPYIYAEFVYFFAQAGEDGHTYKFTITIVTNNGQIAEKDVLMQVVAT